MSTNRYPHDPLYVSMISEPIAAGMLREKYLKKLPDYFIAVKVFMYAKCILVSLLIFAAVCGSSSLLAPSIFLAIVAALSLAGDARDLRILLFAMEPQ